MGIPVVWVCAKCGRKTMASSKPGTNGTNYGKCPKSLDGVHRWVQK